MLSTVFMGVFAIGTGIGFIDILYHKVFVIKPNVQATAVRQITWNTCLQKEFRLINYSV